jgi:hypothetical protein
MPDNSIPKEAAYQIINDELMLDGNPRLNLASFVTTWMEPECNKLMMDSINKNYVDMDEYPVTTELQVRYFFCTTSVVSSRVRSVNPGFHSRLIRSLACDRVAACARLICFLYLLPAFLPTVDSDRA